MKLPGLFFLLFLLAPLGAASRAPVTRRVRFGGTGLIDPTGQPLHLRRIAPGN
jgi:hypothetical protein